MLGCLDKRINNNDVSLPNMENKLDQQSSAMIQDLPHADTTCFEKLRVWNGTRNSDPAMDKWISICATQQVYFFNRATGDSLWMHPRKSIFEEPCLMLSDIWRNARMGLNPMRSLRLT